MGGKVALFCLLFCVYFAHGLPTVYKYNENKMLEPDLIPVSSTVIPLPIYQISQGLQVGTSLLKDEKVKKPDGPINLVTIHSKPKKATEQTKTKSNDVSSVKEVNKKNF